MLVSYICRYKRTKFHKPPPRIPSVSCIAHFRPMSSTLGSEILAMCIQYMHFRLAHQERWSGGYSSAMIYPVSFTDWHIFLTRCEIKTVYDQRPHTYLLRTCLSSTALTVWKGRSPCTWFSFLFLFLACGARLYRRINARASCYTTPVFANLAQHSSEKLSRHQL